jgi:hypothetical protein
MLQGLVIERLDNALAARGEGADVGSLLAVVGLVKRRRADHPTPGP